MVFRRFVPKFLSASAPSGRRSRRQRGSAFLSVLILLGLIAVGSGVYMSRATDTVRQSRRRAADVQTTHLCEAGVQSVLRSLWRPFKQNQ
ncbi:hypothetical protein EON81_28340, partial [bacterium]